MDNNNETDRRLAELSQRVTLQGQEIHHLRSQVERDLRTMEERRQERDAQFGQHMVKEENAFKSFYDKLDDLSKQITGMVKEALNSRNELERHLDDEVTKLRNEIAAVTKQAEGRYMSKEMASYIVGAVALACGVMVWLNHELQADDTDKQTAAIIQAINAAKGQGGK